MRTRIRGLGKHSLGRWGRMLPGQEELDQQEECLGVRLVRGKTDRAITGLRGGSWFNGHMNARTVYRSYDRPAYRGNDSGLRLTRKGVTG